MASLVLENNLSVQIDDCIFAIARSEDMEALERLYLLTSSSVYGFALSILKNTYDAQDAMQESFIQIYNAAPSYKSNQKPLAWMLTITRNLCFKHLNEHKKYVDLSPEEWNKQMAQEEKISSEDKDFLYHCLSELNDEERQIVVLHSLTGFKFREIAKLLKMNLATVLSKHSRALKKLQEQYGKENHHETQN